MHAGLPFSVSMNEILISFSQHISLKKVHTSANVYNEPDFSDEYMPLDPYQHHDFFYYGFMAHGMYVSCCLASTGSSRPGQAQVDLLVNCGQCLQKLS